MSQNYELAEHAPHIAKDIKSACGRCWHNHIPSSGTICMCGCHDEV